MANSKGRVAGKVALVTGGASGLGAESARLLAAEGMTMLIVSHEMAFVREVAGKVVFMADGRIVEVGPPAQIFDAPQTPRCAEFVRRILRH